MRTERRKVAMKKMKGTVMSKTRMKKRLERSEVLHRNEDEVCREGERDEEGGGRRAHHGS